MHEARMVDTSLRAAASSPQEHQISPAAIAIPVLATLACLLCIPPLITHIRARNFAATVLVLGIIIPNIFNITNPLIWPTEDPNTWWNGTGLCDVEVKLEIALASAQVGATACIFRQLAVILDTDNLVLIPCAAHRRRRWALELTLCVGISIYLMIAHYLVQPFRYYIFAVQGCTPSFDNSWLSIVLIFVWPLILCSVATVYCVLAIHRLIRYRRQFSIILSGSASNVSKSRFLRLFALSLTLLLIFLPLAIYTFYQNLSFPRHAYSWSSLHPHGWSKIIIKVPGQSGGSYDRWIQVGTGFLVFPFFGLGQDAKSLYQEWLQKLKCHRRFTSVHLSHGVGKLSSGHSQLMDKREGLSFSMLNRESDTHMSQTHDQDSQAPKPAAASKSVHLRRMNGDTGAVGHPHHTISQTGRLAGSRGWHPPRDASITPRVQKNDLFKIWSDEDPNPAMGSDQDVQVGKEIELSEHTVHGPF